MLRTGIVPLQIYALWISLIRIGEPLTPGTSSGAGITTGITTPVSSGSPGVTGFKTMLDKSVYEASSLTGFMARFGPPSPPRRRPAGLQQEPHLLPYQVRHTILQIYYSQVPGERHSPPPREGGIGPLARNTVAV